MNKSLTIICVVVLAVLSGYGGYYLQQQTLEQNASKDNQDIVTEDQAIIGKPIPDIRLKDLAGVEQPLHKWSGKVLAINFWATWCPPCREEIPDFIELQNQYGEQGLQFLGIALQYPEELTEFLEEFPLNYPTLAGGTDVIAAGKALGNGIGALPYTVIIDKEGIIKFTRRGKLSKSEAESVIIPLL